MTYEPINYFNAGWTLARTYLQVLEPYQPYLAGSKIIGTALWKHFKQKETAEKIKTISKRIAVLKTFLKYNKNVQIKEQIQVLKEERKALRYTMTQNRLSFYELPCLIFEHPGSNVWKSCANISSRCVAISSPKTQSIIHIALSALSIIGTSMALVKQTGLINECTTACHGLIGTAVAISLLEGCMVAKNWLQTRYAT